ncbi:MAG: hypothetical protein JWN70_6590 [Planctomycetaceae bacterium]|nr:hypothetical protein [Planctomycetaceae bacterium]
MSDMDHPKVQPFTRQVASELRLELSFVEFVFNTDRPECFRYWCEPVEGSWTCYIPDDVDVAYPLWACNGDQTLLLLADGQISYGKGYHDALDMEMISRTSQGLLADVINLLYESETTEDELRRAADLCGFRFLTEYLAFIKPRIPSERDWRGRWKSFIEDIDLKST